MRRPVSLEVLWEQWYPLFGAAASTLSVLYIGLSFPQNPENLLSTSASVSSIFASFLGVAKGLILTIKNTETYRKLDREGFSLPFYNFLESAIWSALFLASLSVVGFFIIVPGGNTQNNEYMADIYKFVWIFSAFYSFFSYIRFGRILFSLLKKV